MSAACSIAVCENRAQARGWCSAHYARWRRNGDPLAYHDKTRVAALAPAALFAERATKGEDPAGCWLWAGPLLPNGYGRFGKSTAHRKSWELHHGPIPAGLYVCHSCDVPACVNPGHLWLGTAADNRHDCDAKGRAAIGEALGSSKLTERQVAAIKANLASGHRVAVIAAAHGVTPSTIYRIRKGETWTHVGRPPTTKETTR